MNTKQKRQVLFVLIACFLTVIMSMTYALAAGGGLDAGSVSGGSSTSSSNNWGLQYITGTRYVFRVKDENGNFVDFSTNQDKTYKNGKDCYNYYITHRRAAKYSCYSKHDGYANYFVFGDLKNPTIQKEKDSFKSGKAAFPEVVTVGAWNSGLEYFNGYGKTKNYFFDEPACSLPGSFSTIKSTYPSLFKDATYRHVIVWGRENESVNAEGMGLDSHDIEQLVGALEFKADSNNDTKALTMINQIKNGELEYQIRAEIILFLRCIDKQVRFTTATYTYDYTSKDIITRLTGIQRDGSTCYNGVGGFLTYREAMYAKGKAYIGSDLKNSSGTKIYSKNTKFKLGLGSIAKGILTNMWEKDEPWYSEYIGSAQNKGKAGGSNAIIEGWDYIDVKANDPYKKDGTTVVEKYLLEDGTEIIPEVTTSFSEDSKTFTKPEDTQSEFTPYDYVGLSYDDSTKKDSTKTSQVVPNDNGTHEIIYWYRLKSGIKISYKDEDTGEDIIPPETMMGDNLAYPVKVQKKDLNNYDYSGMEIVLPTVVAKDINKTYTTIENDLLNHEVIFWYKPKAAVVVHYISEKTSKEIGTSAPIYLSNGISKDFNENGVQAYSTVYEYAGKTKVDGGSTTNSPSVTIIGDGKAHDIIFYYNQKVTITVKKVREGSITSEEHSSEDFTIPVKNKTFSVPTWNGYEFLNKYTVDYTTSAYTGQTPQSDGSTATVNVAENSDITAKPISNVVVIFYYKVKYHLTIKHVDKETGGLIPRTEVQTVALIPGEGRDVNSLRTGNYINSDATLDGASIMEAEYKGTQNQYTVTITPDGNDHTLIFYYIKQQVVVLHEYEDGRKIVLDVTVPIPTTQNKKEEYPFKKYELNNNPGTATSVTVNFNPDITGNQKLVFIYGDPDLYIDPKDPDSERAKIAQALNLGVIPSDTNNQYVNQKDADKYWVLDENGTITISFADEDEADQVTGHDVELIFPIDVYIGTEYLETGTPKVIRNVSATPTEVLYPGNGKTYKVYTIDDDIIKNIHIPIWAAEGEYQKGIKATITQYYTEDYIDDSGNPQTSSGSKTRIGYGDITVVGKIYDFSATNLQGDDIWKTSLFTTNKPANGEYEANNLPIGQAKQQNPKYNYGIKQGTKIFFSVNTKGSDNNGIKITPTFYYYDKTGKLVGKVDAYSNGKKLSDLALTRTTTINDTYRVTSELKNEIVKAREKEMYGDIYGKKAANIGNYVQILIGTDLRTPYLGYKQEFINKERASAGKTENDLYKEASHWYGDYLVPSDTKYYKDGTQLAQDGFVVVYFSIISTREKDDGTTEKYLAYNLPSPDSKDVVKTQWQVEQNGNVNFTLPRIAVNGATPTINSWLQGNGETGSAPVAILQINQSTSQNYDSAGTH